MATATPDGHHPAPRAGGFLGLPLELRLEIYRHILIQPQSISNLWFSLRSGGFGFPRDGGRRPIHWQVLLASRQVYAEAVDVLYGENVFQVYLGVQQNSLKVLSAAARERIRHLLLDGSTISDGYKHTFIFDDELWPPLLAGLRHLYIVVPQLPRLMNSPARRERWRVQFRSILQHINLHKPSQLIPEIDSNRLDEPTALVHDCFPGGWREVETQVGDDIFGRRRP